MARPKSENPLADNVPVRLPPEEKDFFQMEAKKKSLPLSTYLRMILHEIYESRQPP